MVSEAQKRSRDKWDKDNMAVLSCKIKKEDADRFKAVCESAGQKPNAVLRDFILSYGDAGDTKNGEERNNS